MICRSCKSDKPPEEFGIFASGKIKLCCGPCLEVAKSAARARRGPTPPAKVVRCEWCGMPFETRHGKYCSDECRRLADLASQRKNRASRNGYVPDPLGELCSVCGAGIASAAWRCGVRTCGPACSKARNLLVRRERHRRLLGTAAYDEARRRRKADYWARNRDRLRKKRAEIQRAGREKASRNRQKVSRYIDAWADRRREFFQSITTTT